MLVSLVSCSRHWTLLTWILCPPFRQFWFWPVTWFLRFLFQETEPDFDHCAVCIESYKQNDVVRILPCKYVTFLCLKRNAVCMSPSQNGYPMCFWEPSHCTGHLVGIALSSELCSPIQADAQAFLWWWETRGTTSRYIHRLKNIRVTRRSDKASPVLLQTGCQDSGDAGSRFLNLGYVEWWHR